MSSEHSASIGTALAVAWRERNRLIGALVPILVPVMVIETVLDLTWFAGEMSVVNGSLLSSGQSAAAQWVGVAVLAAGWSLAIVAGVLVAGGALRGIDVSPWTATREALRRVAPAMMVMAIVVGAGIGLAVVGGEAALGLGDTGPVILAIGAVLVALLLARLILGLAVVALEPAARPLQARAELVTRDRLLPTAGVVVIVAGVLPWLAGQGLTRIADALRGSTDGVAGTALSAVIEFGAAVGLIALVAVQGAVLAAVYVRALAASMPGQDGSLAGSNGDGARARTAMLAAAVPAVVVLLAAVTNPYGAPAVTDVEVETYGTTWAGLSGSGAVIVDGVGVADCQGTNCRDPKPRDGVPGDDLLSAHAIAPDGALVSIRNSHPGASIGRCTRDGECSSARFDCAPFSQPGATINAIAIGEGGRLALATAREVVRASGRASTELTIGHCGDWTCDDIDSAVVLVAEDIFAAREFYRDAVTLLAVELDDAGRPFAILRSWSTWLVSCDMDSCDEPEMARYETLNPYTVPVGGVADGLAEFDDGPFVRIHQPGGGASTPDAIGLDDALVSPAAVARAGDGVVILLAARAPEPGPAIHVGEEPVNEAHRLVLLHCHDLACDEVDRYPLAVVDELPTSAQIVVRGRDILIMYGDQLGGSRITTLELTGQGSE